MKKLLAIAIVTGSMTFGAASFAAAPFRIAILWAFGVGVAAPAAVVTRRVIWRKKIVDLNEDQISFTRPGGPTYGPYRRT